MQSMTLTDKYLQTRLAFFKWRSSATLVKKISLAFAMAFLTGLMAQIRIYLPFTPVPITGQVVAVLLSGVVCGGIFGSISQIIYILLGVFVFNWFAAFSSGGCLLTSATGGYLIGFVIAPLVIGRYTDKHINERGLLSQIKIMMLGVAVLYIPGTIVLASVMKITLGQALLKAVVPFIAIDLIKAAVAGSISSAILPRSPYDEEIDKVK